MLKDKKFKKMELPNSFKGPLGSHQNYLVHIAFENFVDYDSLKKRNAENKRRSTSDKYKEFRLFLNAVESFNNVLDYFYFDFKKQISRPFDDFKEEVHKKYPLLNDLRDLANAYKHCVRTKKNGQKRPNLIWARDLQKPRLNVAIDPITKNVDIGYQFDWPIEGHEQKLLAVWKFWIDYHNHPNPEKMLLETIKA